ncbi:MAG: radical SAM family heme chaperone HemW, partial [Oscillospiraceae bacterium]|nr:radical SAM family heme chaperone HemW [Oscillospiraceae bacterium]
KCPYCDFYSVPYRRETAEHYVAAILRNIGNYTIRDSVDSIYFGGGTPSLLSAAQIGAVLEACAKHFSVQTGAEITLEYNPTGKRDAYLRELHSIGLNRLSVGTQSFSDAQLRLLGRTHSAEENRRAVLNAYDAGFTNISCDLMLAVPDQTESILAETLASLTKLPISHVSAYMLQIEEGTPLSRNAELLRRCPDDDAAVDRYLQAVQTLETAGLHQYEVSSFARTGAESVHNLKYWKCQPYLGIGAGAHSCFGGKRFCVPKDVTAFLTSDHQPETLLDEHPSDREERLMLALRLTEGVPETLLSAAALRKIPLLKRAGYLVSYRDGNISLTPKGFAVSNAVIAELLS